MKLLCAVNFSSGHACCQARLSVLAKTRKSLRICSISWATPVPSTWSFSILPATLVLSVVYSVSSTIFLAAAQVDLAISEAFHAAVLLGSSVDGHVPASQLSTLANNSSVAYISPDRPVAGTVDLSAAASGADSPTRPDTPERASA